MHPKCQSSWIVTRPVCWMVGDAPHSSPALRENKFHWRSFQPSKLQSTPSIIAIHSGFQTQITQLTLQYGAVERRPGNSVIAGEIVVLTCAQKFGWRPVPVHFSVSETCGLHLFVSRSWSNWEKTWICWSIHCLGRDYL